MPKAPPTSVVRLDRLKSHIPTLDALHEETRRLNDRLTEAAIIRANALKLHKRTKGGA